MEIHIVQDLESISTKAARLFIRLSKKYIRSSEIYTAVLSGGATPKRLYQILGAAENRNRTDWAHVHLFWVDERFVPSDHPHSNFRCVQENLLQSVPIPSQNVHPIKTGPSSLADTARAYEAEVKGFFSSTDSSPFPRFDLILLGIGEDGHTASLFPGSGALRDIKRLIVPVRNRDVLHHRVTMTLPVINSAKNILFLVSGEKKASIMEKVVMRRDKKIPASLVKPYQGKCIFITDKDAGRYILTGKTKANAIP